jgi:hypothetical protein
MLLFVPIKKRLRAWLASVALCAMAGVAPGAAAQPTEAPPKPETYLCPHAVGGAIECYLNAVEHLYTMCRQVKSIEIIEFGYEKSDEGVNGAKTEYCIDKHKQKMSRPHQAALREAGLGNKKARDEINSLHERWVLALVQLKWIPGETDEQYKARVAKPYEDFRERVIVVRASLPPPKTKPATAAASAPKKSPN